MKNNVDKVALATLTTELKTYESPRCIHHDITSVLAFQITRRISDEVSQWIAEKLRDNPPVLTLYSFGVLKGTTYVFIIIHEFIRRESRNIRDILWRTKSHGDWYKFCTKTKKTWSLLMKDFKTQKFRQRKETRSAEEMNEMLLNLLMLMSLKDEVRSQKLNRTWNCDSRTRARSKETFEKILRNI